MPLHVPTSHDSVINKHTASLGGVLQEETTIMQHNCIKNSAFILKCKSLKENRIARTALPVEVDLQGKAVPSAVPELQ